MSTTQRFRIALKLADIERRRCRDELVRLYRRHEDWCRRSGYASMSFAEFKASRRANPMTRELVAKSGSAA